MTHPFLGGAAYDVPIQATSNSLDITAMRFELNTGTDAMQILYMLTGSSVSAYGSTKDTWTNAAYRVITFTTPFKRDTNPDFYDWFVGNAKEVKAENLYGYKITASSIPVTVPDSTLTGRGAQSFEGTAPVFNALFWSSADGAAFPDTSLRTKIGCYVHYSVSRYGSPVTYRWSASAYIYSANAADKYNVASHTATKTTSSFVKPATPTEVEPISSAGNLYFADQPTGDLLTWLNANATKI